MCLPKTYLFISLLAVNSATVTVGVWWYFFDSVTIVAKNSEWYGNDRVPRRQFKAGEMAYLSREICSSRNIHVSTSRRLVSIDEKIQNVQPASNGPIKKGCQRFVYGLMMPALPPAEYVLRVTLSGNLNPLATSAMILDSPPYEVVQ